MPANEEGGGPLAEVPPPFASVPGEGLCHNHLSGTSPPQAPPSAVDQGEHPAPTSPLHVPEPHQQRAAEHEPEAAPPRERADEAVRAQNCEAMRTLNPGASSTAEPFYAQAGGQHLLSSSGENIKPNTEPVPPALQAEQVFIWPTEANQPVQQLESETPLSLRTPPGTPPLSTHSSPRTSIARLMARLKQGFSGNGSAKGGGPESGSRKLVPDCETLRGNNYRASKPSGRHPGRGARVSPSA
jgi:hypothetical protein